MAAVVERERMELRDLPVLDRQAAVAATDVASRRIIGYDVARAFAILAMIIDHCAQALGPTHPSGWGGKLLELIDGRASATFVVLAGVGVTLLNRRQTPAEIREVLFRRGAFLLAIGFVNQAIWAGDVLRLFGVTMMAAGFLVVLPGRALLAAAVTVVLTFPALWICFDYNANWDWNTYAYRGLWTPGGAVRNILYDGFRPVIPWAGLLILGMWIGRLDSTRASVRRGLLFWGVGLTAATETLSHVALRIWLAHPGNVSEDTIRAICETGSMPPMPVFVLTVVGTALTVIALALMASHRWPNARLTVGLIATGQMALTWYLFHIAVGALWVRKRGWHSFGSVTRGIIIGVIFFAVLVLLSTLWKRRLKFKYGPMEWVLRNVTK